MIGNYIAPRKTMRDVVDYQYRFKIPDQFRRYQDKKREQALRIMECIEKRRYYERPTTDTGATATNGHSNENGNLERDAKRRKTNTHWSETSAKDVTDATEARRRDAKALLTDVHTAMGRDVVAEVARAVRQLHRAYEPEVRDELFSLLAGQPELQRRFLAFLPKY